MSSSNLQVTTFDHITLVVADLNQSREFYVDLLGMDEVTRPGFDFPGKWFQLGKMQIHLIERHDASGPAGNLAALDQRSSRSHHFAFQIDDARNAETVLKNQGIRIVSSAKERPDGAVQVFVEDPDGHVVELCQVPRDC